MSKTKLLYIDLFCGAGGTSTGVNTAMLDGENCAMVIACVNHDAKAIASHAANHPEAMHFTEDIRTLNLDPWLPICGNAELKIPARLPCFGHHSSVPISVGLKAVSPAMQTVGHLPNTCFAISKC